MPQRPIILGDLRGNTTLKILEVFGWPPNHIVDRAEFLPALPLVLNQVDFSAQETCHLCHLSKDVSQLISDCLIEGQQMGLKIGLPKHWTRSESLQKASWQSPKCPARDLPLSAFVGGGSLGQSTSASCSGEQSCLALGECIAVVDLLGQQGEGMVSLDLTVSDEVAVRRPGRDRLPVNKWGGYISFPRAPLGQVWGPLHRSAGRIGENASPPERLPLPGSVWLCGAAIAVLNLALHWQLLLSNSCDVDNFCFTGRGWKGSLHLPHGSHAGGLGLTNHSSVPGLYFSDGLS